MDKSYVMPSLHPNINTMFTQSIGLVLTVLFQLILAEEPPYVLNRVCIRPPPNVENPDDCCEINGFFKKEDFEECYFPKDGVNGKPQGELRDGPQDCTKPNCFLGKYDLLKDDNPDLEKIQAYITKWADDNPAFKDAANEAIERCAKREIPVSPHVCPASKIIDCIHFHLVWKCPAENWESNAECDAMKAHIEKCKDYIDGPSE